MEHDTLGITVRKDKILFLGFRFKTISGLLSKGEVVL